jgi:hypothetical protein
MRDDLVGMLKSAIEHGESIEDAIQSLINAGYNDEEIKEAVNFVNSGVLSSFMQKRRGSEESFNKNINHQNMNQGQNLNMKGQSVQQNVQMQKPVQKMLMPENQTMQPKKFPVLPVNQITEGNKEKKKFPWLVIILAITLILLLGVLVVSILFKDNILKWFG